MTVTKPPPRRRIFAPTEDDIRSSRDRVREVIRRMKTHRHVFSRTDIEAVTNDIIGPWGKKKSDESTNGTAHVISVLSRGIIHYFVFLNLYKTQNRGKWFPNYNGARVQGGKNARLTEDRERKIREAIGGSSPTFRIAGRPIPQKDMVP